MEGVEQSVGVEILAHQSKDVKEASVWERSAFPGAVVLCVAAGGVGVAALRGSTRRLLGVLTEDILERLGAVNGWGGPWFSELEHYGVQRVDGGTVGCVSANVGGGLKDIVVEAAAFQ